MSAASRKLGSETRPASTHSLTFELSVEQEFDRQILRELHGDRAACVEILRIIHGLEQERQRPSRFFFSFFVLMSWPRLRLNLNTHARLVSGGIRLRETKKRPSLGLSKDFG